MRKGNLSWVLFDADDTLIGLKIGSKVVGTSIGYGYCIELLVKAMAPLGFDEKLVKETQFRIDHARCEKEGFSRKRRFPISFRDTYNLLTKQSGNIPCPETGVFMENLGWRVFDFPASPLPGAMTVLETIAKHYNVAIVTKGNRSHQIEKLTTASCLPHARKIIVMRSKSSEEWAKKLKVSLGISEKNREKSWVVGDSIKSDINPALALGFSAIHIPAVNWAFENAEYGVPAENSSLKIVRNIEGVLEHLL